MNNQKTKTAKTKSRRINWLAYQPTPYNDYLFRNLDSDDEIDLVVHFRDFVLASHPWKSNLAQGYNYRLYNTVLGVDWFVVSLPFREPNSFFLIAGWDHLTSQLLLTILKMFGFQYALWTDTPNLDQDRHPVISFTRSIWLKWIFSGSTQILATGQPGIANLKQMGARDDKLINFPFFLDLYSYTRLINPRQYNIDNPLRFISSGRVKNSLKGHDIAIRALAIAVQKCQSIPFEYYIAGTGPDEAELIKLVQVLGIEDKVKFLGWAEPEMLRELYLKSDVLIHPSPIHDPFPNAVLEGMAAGLAVLGSDVSGSATDRVENGVSGFIHQAGNVDELAEQIIMLLTHPERIANMGISARRKAEQWPVSYGVNTIKSISTQC